MEKSKSENRIKYSGIYYESHHIIPKCLGGKGSYKQWETHPNIVLLTAKEHFIAHKLLCEIYPDNDSLLYAYFMMCNVKGDNQERNYRIGSKEYERIKNLYSIIQSKSKKGKNNPMYGKKRIKHSENMKGTNNPFYGKKHSEETIKKLSKINKGRPSPYKGKKHYEESKRKMSESKKGRLSPNKGKKLSEETKRKLSENMKGKYIGENSSNVKLTEKEVIEIREKYKSKKYTYKSLGEEYNITTSMIYQIVSRRSWTHI